MDYDLESLKSLKENHPAWRLLAAYHGPRIISFLYRMFVAENVRSLSASDLINALADEQAARPMEEEGFDQSAAGYLNRWATPSVGWLRKFYPPGSDEPHFDLTPAAEKAIHWVSGLTGRSFVGTESRLLTLVDLLRQISEGTEVDPAKRIEDLQKRRDAIDAEITRIAGGDLPMLTDTAIKDRFQQFEQLERELLSDFREVEQNFRTLDRRVHERIAMWEGGKGALLAEILDERHAIDQSDQGRSFHGFWSFLMSSSRKADFANRLEQILAHPAVIDLHPDQRIRRILRDWLEAGESAQRTVASLSKRLRRFIDDRAHLENRRIMEILGNIERNAIALRESPPSGDFMEMNGTSVALALPMERPLFTPKIKVNINSLQVEAYDDELGTDGIRHHAAVDKAACVQNIQLVLMTNRGQTTLKEVLDRFPLGLGLAELLAYLELAVTQFRENVDISDESIEDISWVGRDSAGNLVHKTAHAPRVIFRDATHA